ncbi:MAG: Eco57I restriction-modification methylase domain-containing protein [bacterium]|nr:Eco57I restriction-modification methylase domain-containing protein [bacterium]
MRGIIHIFNDYKFTIEENTPIEEDVALDPELLGRVFENLLAAYNPETKSTARKQTGSFYTPREIVDYMVERALIYTLETRFQEQVSSKVANLRKRLEHLVSYDQVGNPFSPDETIILIKVIDRLKVLDPACGSGAFPMGFLHKLVHILQKLDPGNVQWKERQVNRIERLIAGAHTIEDSELRDRTLEDLEDQRQSIFDAFARDELNFSRKLFLIENCIYGVDIQPIAVQIAKLRFFISLVVEQKPSTDRMKNLGIHSLPNLETKIVAANTLIGLDKPDGWLPSYNILKLERQLDDVRHQHFSVRNQNRKRQCRERDKELRRQISDLLEAEGFLGSVGKEMADWDPYDQNASAEFFDPEWMFGLLTEQQSGSTFRGNMSLVNDTAGQMEFGTSASVTTGFDITIGNPPYVRADEQSEWNRKLREAIFDCCRREVNRVHHQYETLWEKWDLYIPFIEKAFKLLRPGGVTSLIVSDAFCHSKYAQKPQNWYLKNALIIRLDFFSKIKIFDAAVRNMTFFFQKANGTDNRPERRVHDPEFGNVNLLLTNTQPKLTYRCFFPEDKNEATINIPTVPIANICYLSYGLAASSDEKRFKGEFVTDDVTSDSKDELHPKPWVEGKLLAKWLPVSNRWLEWGTDRAPSKFRRVTFKELFDAPEKLLILVIGGDDLKICYDDNQLYTNHSSVICVPWHALNGIRNRSIRKSAHYRGESPALNQPTREQLEEISKHFSVKYLLAILNSSPAREFLRANRRSNTALYPDDWKKLPIPDVPIEQQTPIVALVDQILDAKRKAPHAEIGALEARVDDMIKQLYGLTEEEIAVVEGGTNGR